MKKIQKTLISSFILVFILLMISSVNAIEFENSKNTDDIQAAVADDAEIVLNGNGGSFDNLGTINISANNVVIRGENNAKIIRTTINDGNNRILFNITGFGVVIKDLYIENYNTAISAKNTNSITIKDLNITTNLFNGRGIDLNNTNNSFIDNNRINISGDTVFAIYITNSSNNNIKSNYINNTAEYGYSIYLYNVSNNNISDNQINTTDQSAVGIYIWNSSNNNVNTNYINTTGGYAYGIHVYANSNANNISSNYINTSGGNSYGVYVYYSSYNTSITNNFITTTGSRAYGVYIQQNSNDNNITGNDIITNAPGIQVNGAIINSNITYNRILSNTLAINFTTTTQNNIVEANWFGTNNLTEIQKKLQLNNTVMNSYYIMVLNSSTVNNNSDLVYGSEFVYSYYLVLNDSSLDDDVNKLPDFEVTVELFNGSSETFNPKESDKQWDYKVNKTGELIASVLSQNYTKSDALITNFVINGILGESKIAINPVNGTWNHSVILNATLKNSSGSPIVGRDVLFFVDGVNVANATTDGDGVAIYSYLLNLSSGVYDVFAFFEGDEYYSANQTSSFKMIVSAQNTSITIVPVNGTWNHFVILNATLKNSSGSPIVGRDVLFFVDGVNVANATTDGDGVAIYSYLLNLSSGVYDVFAFYKGDEYYSANQTSAFKMIVSAQNTIITIVGEGNHNVGDTYTLIANLTGDGPVAGKEVIFYLNGKEIGRNKTNSQGIAYWHYTFTNTGDYTFSAKFSGDENYTESTFVLGLLVVDEESNTNNPKNNTVGGSHNYVGAYSSMEKTGIQIIAIILVLLTCLGLIGKKEN